MKFLSNCYDPILEMSYDLYMVNANELSRRLINSYGLDWESLQLFNSESKLLEKINVVREYQKRGYTNEVWVQTYKQALEDQKMKVSQGEVLTDNSKQGVLFGYQTMPVAVSTSGLFEDEQTSLELIDGFKRLLCSLEVPDIDIMVKVYGTLDDTQWINAMMMYNSWKFANGNGSQVYMDRGFQLGFSQRYGIHFANMDLFSGIIFQAIDLYAPKRKEQAGVYTTYWDNPLVSDDLKAIYWLLSYNPQFTITKKKKVFTLNRSSDTFQNVAWMKLPELFVSTLGVIRRMEYRKGLTRKPFEYTLFTDILKDQEMQKHFYKMCSMQVGGFSVNYFEKHLEAEIRNRIYKGMGYPNPKNKVLEQVVVPEHTEYEF